MSKVRVAYNNVFRLLFGYRRSCSASEMFVNNNIYTFEGRMRKHINDFTMRIGSSSNILIATLRENSFILAGPLGLVLSSSECTVQYFVLCIEFYVFLSCMLWASGPEIKLSYRILYEHSIRQVLIFWKIICSFKLNV